MRQRNRVKIFWQSLGRILSVFDYGGRALSLVWNTSRSLTVVFAILTLVAGLMPAGIAYIGKLIIDGVVFAARSGSASARTLVLLYLGLEAVAVALQSGSKQGLNICQSLLRVLLGQKVNVLILEKALTLDLDHFEDSEFYDKMTRARREASTRPLSLVNGSFGLLQNLLSLITYGGLLLRFNYWVVIILMVSAIPAFIAETRYAGWTSFSFISLAGSGNARANLSRNFNCA